MDEILLRRCEVRRTAVVEVTSSCCRADVGRLEIKDRLPKMVIMVDAWANGRTDIDTATDQGKAQVAVLVDGILNGHDRGQGLAQKYLTDTVN
ncbi:hypothetical protein [Streptomyces sp. TP-A0875]|uniref:hypothetical protein n=1 Tax=Streptomyces sp. TP-A0875 TaxID=552354 RepID=UPI0018FE1582|nr:hypothetical protein [Streptomyces sp. TP-A0875]